MKRPGVSDKMMTAMGIPNNEDFPPRDIRLPNAIYVVAHDGGCEGHSLPMLAFRDKETALKWCRSQPGRYSVAEVPIFPELPACEWFHLEKVTS